MKRLLIIAALLCCPAWATNYYVATTGTDSGTCIVASPCATFYYAATQASPGDTVLVESGTYGPQDFTAGVHGSTGNLITVEPQVAGTVTLTRTAPASNTLQGEPLLDLNASTYLRVTGFTIIGMQGRSDWNPAIYADNGFGDTGGEVTEDGAPENQYITLDHLTIENSTDNCIKIGGFSTVSYNTIANCGFFPHIGGHGIYVSKPNTTVSNNSINGSAGEGIQTYDTGEATNNVVITNNIVTNVIHTGILTWGGNNDTITGNFVYGNGEGMDIKGTGHTISYNVISRNTYNAAVQSYSTSGTFNNNPIYSLKGGHYGVVLVASTVWVSNSANNTISIYNTDGSSAGSDITGNSMNQPGMMTVAGTEVWVVNGCPSQSSSGTVSRFNFNGTSAGTPLSTPYACGIATVSSQVWVTAASPSTVYLFNCDGTSAGSNLTGNGMNYPWGIGGVVNGSTTTVWVGNENGGGSISLFNTDGSSAGSPITGNGVAYPAGIAVVGSQVWVSDNQSYTISQFSLSGTAIGTFTLTGANLVDPTQIAIVGGNVWIGSMNDPSNGPQWRGIGFSGVGSNINIYNNTFSNNGGGSNGAEIGPYAGSSAFNIKNNIFDDSGLLIANVLGVVPTASTVDYNIYHNTTAPASPGTHSIVGDPKFINASGNNFTLASGSPAIDAGTNLGSTYQMGLAPFSSWPSSVSTLDQNSYGTGWAIGAFVFVQQTLPAPPANLSATVK